jgi:5,5'-dehydrodivanillate O-demethylase
VAALRANWPTAAEAGRSILAGKSKLADYKQHPVFVAFKDTAAQSSQGVIADRTKEKLGISDAGVVYLRRLMARELSLLADGKPTKDWRTDWKMPDSKSVFL